MKVNKKGMAATGLLVAASMLTLAGCAGGSSAAPSDDASKGDSDALTVWVDANRARALEDVAKTFEQDKGVKVNLVVKDYDKIRDEFTAQVPTGKGPDITIGGHDWIGAFVKDGIVAPVELGDKSADFEKVAMEAVSYDGKTYGLPYAIENIAILRNTALADSTPATFDEMIAKGRAAGTEYPFVVGLDPQTADPYHLYPFQTSFGNSVFARNADGSYDPSQLTIGDEAGQQFAGWLTAQGDTGTKVLNLNLSDDLAKEAFNAGKSPYFLTGPWNVADAQSAGVDVSVDVIPSAGGSAAQPFAGVQAFFLSAKSTNPIVANEFLVNYIATDDVQTKLFEAGGRPPALTESFEAAQSDPIVRGFATVGANAVPMPSIPEMGSVWDDWGKTEAALIKGSADPAADWVKMADAIKAKLG
ncbi:sugar ABC transporter substrate-binding protein [Microbacterium lacticum]|uniref:Carbohydrate ABC transporter substrate-binding protein (CUT1 family) n=1 Tax=Microbacterium lacticum TaxID=33885 RepID=A0A4Y3UR53_9MICO|nr:extracellular solute-binding protein [Microbacterium lacticum]TQN01013.1 carbohydrate ABC transporter substrate-binding protein (CUT1 family) [Microbacterium lacticum]GEB95969.1 sugar ABC transporter substrate-binding protein [Microbacterium lacticum]GGI71190.1 sugar ABC transporter substrate-binding protein [Microbacterium lacticum]